MPKWIHDRAQHLMARNPKMSESQAWAIATQQSHSLGKTPKSYGTVEGRRAAKAKYDTPKDDEHTANPDSKRASLAGFTDELGKIAAVSTALLPHQQRVVDRIQQENQPGLLVVHGLGSGKTLTSIAAQDALGQPSQVIAPAALLGNYEKERAKHLKGKTPPASLMSMQNMATKGVSPTAPLLVVDEAHRARDPGSATFQTLKGNTSQKRLLLTGSPFYNHPSDIAPLIDLAADAKVLPYDKDEFTRRYITEKAVNPSLFQRAANLVRSDENKVKPGVVPVLYQKTAPELRDVFKKWVDFHPGSTENFPEVERRDVRVPMTPDQLKVYDTLMGQAPAWVAAKVKRGLPPSKQESQQLNAFLGAARQATNTTAPFVPAGTKAEDPKIQKAFESLQATLAQDPTSRAVVYSNYLPAGIDPYKRRLDEAKIPYGEFTGSMPSKKREQLVKDYNAGKLRTLLLSSAGGEGLDLKGTRLMQILEPHWNAEKLKQVEGRGARYMSHADLPPEKRKLLIENYLASRPEGTLTRLGNKLVGREPDKSVDEYLAQMSKSKEDLINQFRALLPNQEKKAAIATTEASKELSSSWKPRVAAELAYTLPGVAIGAGLMQQVHPAAAAVSGLAGGAIGHLIAKGRQSNLMAEGRDLARQALKTPAKENALREGAENLDWKTIGKSIALRTGVSAMPMAESLLLGNKRALGLAAATAGAHALGALGTGYLDKYRRMIALNELENVRAHNELRDAEKLKRMRRQIAQLETKVEGDGWKKNPTPEVATPEPPKDSSGKGW
jgi:hypothetical protein